MPTTSVKLKKGQDRKSYDAALIALSKTKVVAAVMSDTTMNDEEKADSLKAATKKFRNTWFGKNSMNMKRFMPLIPTADTDEDDDEDDDDDDDDDDDEIDDDDDEEYDEEDDDDDDADDDDDDEVEEDNSDSDEEEVLEVPVSPVKVTKKKSLFTPDKKNGKKASKTKKDTKKVPSPSKKDNAPKESKREVSSVADVHFFTKNPCHSMAYLKTKVLLMVNADGAYAALFLVSLDGSNLSWQARQRVLTSLAANNITCKNANVTKTVLGLDWIAKGKLDDYVLESGIDPKMLTNKTSEVMYMDNSNMFLAGMTASDEIERTLQMTAWRQQLKRYCNIVVTEIQEVSQHGHYADVDEDAGKVDEVSIKKITKVPPKTNDRSNVKRRASASVAKAVAAVQGKRRKK